MTAALDRIDTKCFSFFCEPALTTILKFARAIRTLSYVQLIAMLKEVTQSVFSTAKGFVSSSFHATKDGKQVITYSQWQSVEDVAAMRQIPAMAPYLQRLAATGQRVSPTRHPRP